MTSFHRSLWLGFLVAVPTAVCVVNRFESRYFEPPIVPLELPVDRRLVDRAARHSGKAKRMHLFWASGAYGDGVGIRLLDDAVLFDSVFPGYAAAIPDRPLWARYFRQWFHRASFNPLLSRPGAGVEVWNSWTGNLDLFSRYGADVVILGNSQSTALSPGFLRDRFAAAGPALRGGKILPFFIMAMQPDEMVLALQVMNASGRKARVAVLAYSLDILIPRSGGGGPAKNQNVEVFGKWRHQNMWLRAKLDSAARLLDWNRIVWFHRGMLEYAGKNKVSSRRIDGFTAHKGALEASWAFPDGLAGDEGALEKIAAATPVERSTLDYFGASCDLTKAAASLDRILNEMQAVAPRVVVYLTPTTPLYRRSFPDCITEGVRKMLRSRAGERVIVETGDWDSYGLDYKDYVHPWERSGFSRIDLSHSNFSGSQKIVSKIGELILRATDPGS